MRSRFVVSEALRQSWREHCAGTGDREMKKQPAPQPMKKTAPRTAPSGKKGAPDMTYGGKPLGPKGDC